MQTPWVHSVPVLHPDLDSYLATTGGTRPMPIYSDRLADLETPLSAYWKLSQGEIHSFLLESVTGGEQLARYSILGVRPKTLLRTKDRMATVGEDAVALDEGQDPLDFLQAHLGSGEPIEVPGLPNFIGGAVGLLGYDIVRFFERLDNAPPDDLKIPELAMMLFSTIVVFDHARNLIRVIGLADGSESGYEYAKEEIERLLKILGEPLPPLPSARFEPSSVSCNTTQPEFEEKVRKIKNYIRQGDGIQMVPSLRLRTEFKAHPLTLYRALRSINPSPYMFLLRFGDMDVVGASPELLVALKDGEARVRPIAGTRKRGATPEEDIRLGEELLADEKEVAEHVMLVDLGRNDLGRVCEFGTVKVREQMVIERYSHVMHIVSDVIGRLRKDSNAFDLIRATFPAGTLSGAPKVRAMQIIDEVETTRRGLYGGAVGMISRSGDMDLAIAIRTVLLKDGYAYVQAGAGIVFDSDPAKEFEECLAKAQAPLKAIELANKGLEI